MAFDADQTARLQSDIDNNLPRSFLQSDAEKICSRLADIFLTDNRFNTDPGLLAACNGLKLVGRQMGSDDIEADAPSAEHEYIEGVYSRGGNGYTQFLRAYADAFRKWDTLNVNAGSIWNPATWGDAIKGTFKDIGDVTGSVGIGAADILKWAAIGLIAVFAIVLALRIGGKA